MGSGFKILIQALKKELESFCECPQKNFVFLCVYVTKHQIQRLILSWWNKIGTIQSFQVLTKHIRVLTEKKLSLKILRYLRWLSWFWVFWTFKLYWLSQTALAATPHHPYRTDEILPVLSEDPVISAFAREHLVSPYPTLPDMTSDIPQFDSQDQKEIQVQEEKLFANLY